jgi:hypothetical protein
MLKTLNLIETIGSHYCSAFVFYPFPKTKMFDLSVELGVLDEEGQRKVLDGACGFHESSILNHPHKALAEALEKIAPLYVRAPGALKPVLKWLIARQWRRPAVFLYLLFSPFLFSQISFYWIADYVGMTLKFVFRTNWLPSKK